MTLSSMRRRGAPLALFVCIVFMATLLPPTVVRAGLSPNGDVSDATPSALAGGTGGLGALGQTPADPTPETTSAAVDLATGSARTQFTFALPPARGRSQPSLALSYRSGAAMGYAGLGWGLSIPSIVRKGTSGGLPRFTDEPSAPTFMSDEYWSDDQLLVPICATNQGACTAPQPGGGAQPGEAFPALVASGWTYFRAETDDGNRYFLSQDGKTWVVQSKDGNVRQFGHALDTAFPDGDGTEETDAFTASQAANSISAGANPPAGVTNPIFRWRLVRETDSSSNTVYYVWSGLDGIAATNGFTAPALFNGIKYLADVYDTPQTNSQTPPVFAHHAHLRWALSSALANAALPPAVTPIWRAKPMAALSDVDVTSASWGSVQRQLVRRYHLAYQPNAFASQIHLHTIALEGQCTQPINEVLTNGVGLLPATNCPEMPNSNTPYITYTYTPDMPLDANGNPTLVAPEQTPLPSLSQASPSNSWEPLIGSHALLDVDGDGRADMVYGVLNEHHIPLGGGDPNTGDYGFEPWSIYADYGPPTPSALEASWQYSHPSGADPGSPLPVLPNLNVTPFDLEPGSPKVVYGDWRANGRVSWLFFDNSYNSGGAQGYLFFTPAPKDSLLHLTFTYGFTDTLLPAGGRPTYWGPTYAADLDGDGIVDQVLVPESNNNYISYLSQRDRSGITIPFNRALPGPGTPVNLGPELGADGVTPVRGTFVADFDGDGLNDLYFVKPSENTSGHVFTNRGNGTFGNGLAAAGTTDVGYTLRWGTGAGGLVSTPYGMVTYGDINGDGLADYVSTWRDVQTSNPSNYCYKSLFTYVSQNPQFSICIRTLGRSDTDFACVQTDAQKLGLKTSCESVDMALEIADVDGNGQPSVLWSYDPGPGSVNPGDPPFLDPGGGPQVLLKAQLNPANPPGLLQTIVSYTGLQTAIEYDTARNTVNGDFPAPGTYPANTWVVSHIDVGNILGGVAARQLTKDYLYYTPLYDPRDKVFAGFQRTIEATSGSPRIVREVDFATDACQLHPNPFGPSEDSGDCVGSPDTGYFYRTTRGLPLFIAESDGGTSTVLRGTQNVYQWDNLYLGVDGHRIRQRTLHQRNVFLWDATNQPTLASYIPAVSNQLSGPVELPVGTPTASTEWDYDAHGDLVTFVDYGRRPADDALTTKLRWNLAPGDTTGWNYRVTQAALGYGSASPRVFNYSYDWLGRLTQIAAPVTGTLALVDATGVGQTAGPPVGATHDTPSGSLGLVLGAVTQYDEFGNPTHVSGPLGRQAVVAYDAQFQQWPQTTTEYDATGALALTSSQVFDVGFGVIKEQDEPHASSALPRRVMRNYDGFGRLIEVDQPDPQMSGATAIAPALTIQYTDTGPIRTVRAQTVDGPVGATTTVDHYRFLDGFGDLVAALDQAAPEPGGSVPRWVVSGAHSSYPNGLLKTAAQPFYYQGAASAFQPVQTSFVSRTASYQYDVLNRTTSFQDYNGNATLHSYNAASISEIITDPEQQAGGLHAGSTTVYRDGHGRSVEVREARATVSPQSSTMLSTKRTFLPTGELSTLTQSTSAGIIYQRWMQYDSLGRLVLNAEPNTASGFTAPGGAGGGSMKAWTYAYDDAGEVVGVRDARGCGENVAFDGLGRVTAEDYTPCTSTQAPYTMPSAATGVGTEAFYVYDGYGEVVRQYDRGQFSTYGYDARGRLHTIQRRLAPPSLSGPASVVGSGQSQPSISGTVFDALGNPLSGVMLQITLAGTVVQTQTTDVNGQYVFANLSAGSYQVKPSQSGCGFTPDTMNFNGLSSAVTQNFQGSGGSCGGTPSTTYIQPAGTLSIQGVIADDNGAGVPGLLVTLSGSTQGGPPYTHTDSNGAYVFPGLAGGSGKAYTVAVSGVPSGCTISGGGNANLNTVPMSGTVVQDFAAHGTCPEGGSGVGAELDARYTPHVFSKIIDYNEANRPIDTTTGADVAQLTSAGSQVNYGYTPQGIANLVTSSYGTMLASRDVFATGQIRQQTLGDAASTTSVLGYDGNGILTSYAVTSAGKLLTQLTIVPDKVGNPKLITDTADPSVWPSGAEPVAVRQLAYWDDYRIRESQASYGGAKAPDDAFSSPYAAEQQAGSRLYPQSLTSTPANRTRDQQFGYDARGNLLSSTDDANAFLDRSLGVITPGSAGTASATGPDQVASASLAGVGSLAARYDAAGNLGSLSASAGSSSSTYTYGWDELGRLATAARQDEGQAAVAESFAYDAAGNRVLKSRQLTDGSGNLTVDHTAQVFDSLVLQHAGYPGALGDYERDAKTEHVYLNEPDGTILAHGFYAEQALPDSSGPNGNVHLFMQLGDALGSASIVLDHDSGEVVERMSYQPYGGVESDYRPARWDAFREDVRYTGHWDDSEVGLVYFGARYYSPQLARWISPDPLAIHGLSGDPNPYAFVRGAPLTYVDALGLDGDSGADVLPPPEADPDSNGVRGCIGAECTAPGYTAFAANEAGGNIEQYEANANQLGAQAELGYASGSAAHEAAQRAGGAPSGLPTAQVATEVVKSAIRLDGFDLIRPPSPQVVQLVIGLGTFVLGAGATAAGGLGVLTGLTAEVPSLGGSTALVAVSATLATAGAAAAHSGLQLMMAAAKGGGGSNTSGGTRGSGRTEPFTNRQAREAANKLGYQEAKDSPVKSHGQLVFQQGNRYISPDVDVHSGGAWKMFDRLGNRLGTFNDDLTVRIGD